jgi:SAM-dependent methyltransferase
METKPFQIRWCRACDYGLFSPRPSDDELRTFYTDLNYYTHQPEGADPNVGRYSHLPPATLLDRLRIHLAWKMDRGVPVDDELIAGLIKPPARVCDIGCGSGELLSRLWKKGFHGVGVEPDARARTVSEVNEIPIYPGTAEDLPDPVRSSDFDVVAMIQTLEHCVDPVHAIRQAAGLVRPGGYLVVEVPNNGSLFARTYGPSWFHADYGRHLNFFSNRASWQPQRWSVYASNESSSAVSSCIRATSGSARSRPSGIGSPSTRDGTR